MTHKQRRRFTLVVTLCTFAAMTHSSYPLQALLYGVALHRYLRWRQPGYDPSVHLGGVLYLFVRGMCGPDTPTVDGVPCGVFSWVPPAPLVVSTIHMLRRYGLWDSLMLSFNSPLITVHRSVAVCAK